MRRCGIYGIFSAIDGKVSVGSSSDIDRRWRIHRWRLRKNTHPNPHLQAAWNKYGENVFEFRILEECSKEVLIPREDYWMAFHRSLDRRYGYNMQTATCGYKVEEIGRKVAVANRGKIPSPEARQRMREAQLRIWATIPDREKRLKGLREMAERRKSHNYIFPEAVKRKIAKTLMGNIPWNKGIPMRGESKKKLSLAKREQHITSDHLAKLMAGHKRYWDRKRANQLNEQRSA